MDQERFDRLIASLTTGWNRRRAILGMFAGTTTTLTLAVDADAKKGRKKKKRKRCRRIQAVCRSNKQCCPGKTGRVCASNAKDVACNQESNVCCLPLNSLGCTSDCDCCGGANGCDFAVGRCFIKF